MSNFVAANSHFALIKMGAGEGVVAGGGNIGHLEVIVNYLMMMATKMVL